MISWRYIYFLDILETSVWIYSTHSNTKARGTVFWILQLCLRLWIKLLLCTNNGNTQHKYSILIFIFMIIHLSITCLPEMLSMWLFVGVSQTTFTNGRQLTAGAQDLILTVKRESWFWRTGKLRKMNLKKMNEIHRSTQPFSSEFYTLYNKCSCLHLPSASGSHINAYLHLPTPKRQCILKSSVWGWVPSSRKSV